MLLRRGLGIDVPQPGDMDLVTDLLISFGGSEGGGVFGGGGGVDGTIVDV